MIDARRTHSAFHTAVQSPFVCIGGPAAVPVAVAAAAAGEVADGDFDIDAVELPAAAVDACFSFPLPLSDILSFSRYGVSPVLFQLFCVVCAVLLLLESTVLD